MPCAPRNAALQHWALFALSYRPMFGVLNRKPKGKHMTSFFSSMRAASRKRSQYNRTLAELQTMSHETLIDFDLAPNDLSRLAHDAVYGK